MQAHQFGHFGSEMRLEPFMAKFLVPIINPLIGRIVTKIMHHMTDIMQQSRDDHGIAHAFLLGKPSALQGMLLLIDKRQAIAATRFLLRQTLDFAQDVVLHVHRFPSSK